MNNKGFEYCSTHAHYEDSTCEKFERYFKKRNKSLRLNLNRINSGDIDAWLLEQVAKWSSFYCGVPDLLG